MFKPVRVEYKGGQVKSLAGSGGWLGCGKTLRLDFEPRVFTLSDPM